MDAREVAEAISDGINRLVSLMQDDASDDDTMADIQRLIDALEALVILDHHVVASSVSGAVR